MGTDSVETGDQMEQEPLVNCNSHKLTQDPDQQAI
jgi:hypothetical protein